MDQQLFPSFLRLLMHLRLTLQHSIVHVLILQFPIALIVAWTPDPRFFNAKCSLLFKVTLLLSESASNSRVFLSCCIAQDRNTTEFSRYSVLVFSSKRRRPNVLCTVGLPQKLGFNFRSRQFHLMLGYQFITVYLIRFRRFA